MKTANIYWYMDILRRMDMFLITKILDLAYVQNYTFARSLRSLNCEDSDKYTPTITCLHD